MESGPTPGSFRARLRDGEILTAIFSIIPSPIVVEILALAGFEAVIVDMEHGPTSLGDLPPLIMAVERGGAVPIVRVPECSEHVIGAVLDIGAAAVLVPQVGSAEAARRAVSAARYAPEGTRGVNPWTRAARYGKTTDWTAKSNRDATVMVMVEGREGLDNLDAILDVPGVDGIFLGPVDMAHSLGVPGQPDHPTVVAAIADAAERARRRGVAVGVFARQASAAARWIGRGPTFLGVSEDTATIFEAMSALRAEIANSPQGVDQIGGG